MDRLREQTGRHPDDPEQRMELWLAIKARRALGSRLSGEATPPPAVITARS
jgi:purine catabolism regulator